MNPAGMVHALERIHNCLATGGLLIDIHPAGEPPPIFLRTVPRRTLLGWLGESDYFIEYHQAHRALAQAVTTGLFSLVEHRDFIFEIEAGDIAELDDFLKTSWSDAVLEGRLFERANLLQRQAAGSFAIILAERVHILKMVSLKADKGNQLR